MWKRLERKISFLNCLFVYFIIIIIFLPSTFLFFFFLLFLLSAFFFPSAFFYPHFPIRIRHPQVSGPRFTDTPGKLREMLALHSNRHAVHGRFTLKDDCERQVWNAVAACELKERIIDRCSTWAIKKHNLWARYFTSWRHYGWRLDCKPS